jgi:hypothetical protein
MLAIATEPLPVDAGEGVGLPQRGAVAVDGHQVLASPTDDDLRLAVEVDVADRRVRGAVGAIGRRR